MTTNQELFDRAQTVLPGGVNSPVRAHRAVGGIPLVLANARGSRVWDVQGAEYVDFVCSWGPLVLGHSHPAVVEAVIEAARRGTTYGAPCRDEVLLAEHVVGAYPAIEQIRCVSSGTEAVMSAVRLARGATGRDGIVKFSGCYHGHVDALLVEAGSGLATFGVPSSAGIPDGATATTHILPLANEDALVALMDAMGEQIAAIIIEPMPANNGLLLQERRFLSALRRECDKHGALLIFDEVISGFRIARGGAAQRYDISPDIATFGKIIGGGLPVGAFGASRAIMANLAPQGPVYQAGTLSGNPLAMASGLATLRALDEADGWTRLEELGQHLDATLGVALRESGAGSLVREGSVFWMNLQPGEPPRSAEEIGSTAADIFTRIFWGLRERGVCLAPSRYEVGFLSLAHTREDIERLAEGVAASLAG